MLPDIREGLGVHQRSVLSDSALRDGRGNAGDRQQGHQDIHQGEPANVGFRNSLTTKKMFFELSFLQFLDFAAKDRNYLLFNSNFTARK